MGIETLTLLELSGIVAFVVASAKAIEYLAQPVKSVKKRLKDLEDKTQNNQKEVKELHEFMRVNFVAIRELLKHEIEGGNNKEGMMKASAEIDNFLSKKI